MVSLPAMPQFTFIHAADLHLGAPFKGLDAAASGTFSLSGREGNLLAEAGFTALRRLEFACKDHNAAFLILSGDIYDDKDGVLHARFALRDMFLRLQELGVLVFIAHGNHDPLQSGPPPVAWPDNVTVFGKEVSAKHVVRDDLPLALVKGISHTNPRETENLALWFRQQGQDDLLTEVPNGVSPDIFRIAVLHCAVGGAGEGHAPYAPCTLSDLTDAGMDYWALGHVHQGKTLCNAPAVVYPGSLQGLHINETGRHGCCVVQVDGKTCAVKHLPLASVIWEKLPFVVTDAMETLDVLEEAILAALMAEAGERQGTDFLFCRIILEGATPLDTELRRPGSLETLLDRLREEQALNNGTTRVWIKDLRLATSPARDFAVLSERDDLVGEIVRMAASMMETPTKANEVVVRAIAPLNGNPKLKKILAESGEFCPDALPDEAKSLLCSLLEGGE